MKKYVLGVVVLFVMLLLSVVIFGNVFAGEEVQREEKVVGKTVEEEKVVGEGKEEKKGREDGGKKEKEKKEKEKKEKKKDKKKDKKEVKKEVKLKEEEFTGKYVSVESLNVREKPSMGSSAVSVLSKGETVNVIKKTEEDGNRIVWYKIESGNKTGWVSSKYMIKYEKEDKAVGKKETKVKETKSKNTTSKNTKVKVESATGDYMSTNVINVYDNAKGNVVGKLNPYQKIVVTNKAENSGLWYKVSFKGQTFWVRSGDVVKYDGNKVKQVQESKSKTTAKSKTSNNTGNKDNTSKSSSNTSKKYDSNRIYYSGKSVHYQNTGMSGINGQDGRTGKAQSVIDNTSSAATFGGAGTFSGTDGLNTHFIGHSHKQFSGIQNASTFIITDSTGRAFEYSRTAVYIVNESGARVDTGESRWDRIVGTGGGERVVLQTTEVHPRKWIVEANFNREIK